MKYIRELEDDTQLTRVLKYLKTRDESYYSATLDEITQAIQIKKSLLYRYVSGLPFFKSETYGSVKLVMRIRKENVKQIKNTFSECESGLELCYTFLDQYSVKERFKTFQRLTKDVRSMNNITVSNDHYNQCKKVYKCYSI